jgi:hypothetical protein
LTTAVPILAAGKSGRISASRFAAAGSNLLRASGGYDRNLNEWSGTASSDRRFPWWSGLTALTGEGV